MQNNDLVKLALSLKNKSKTRDLVPLYKYAEDNKLSEEELTRVMKQVGL